MKRMRLDLTMTVFVLLLFAATVVIAGAQPPGDRADKKGQVHLKPVPDVVGLFWLDAEDALLKAGFKSKLTEEDTPDPSVVVGHVRATVPAAGTLAKVYQEIELLIPCGATRVGIGELSLGDFERRTGFDLDEGRYEEIYRGADIVLRRYDEEHYKPGQGPEYIEPIDSSVLARLDSASGKLSDSLGSFFTYTACDDALNGRNRTLEAKIRIFHPLVICVFTSKHQIAAVEYRVNEGFEFHYAIFPPRPAVKAIGRTKVPGTTTGEPTRQPISICEAARQARARNSPAARGLEESCRGAGAAGETSAFNLNDLAARGETVAGADPLAVELRNQQPEDARRGFDIGMAAAEGQTAPGPGKQKIHDTLGRAEQRGFDAAVAFSLERNRNADLAAKGAVIAAQDPIVAEARAAESDVFYWLGFDIATGIFGDPALGANGNTSTGPGSLKIRDSLSAAGQRGFNASVKLHLSRNYRP